MQRAQLETAAPALPASQGKPALAEAGRLDSAGDVRLLVLDDDPIICRLIQAALATHDFHIDAVSDLALIIHVKEAFFHCGKSMIRSGMWEPDKWGSIEGLPSYAQALKAHGNLSNDLADLAEIVAHNEAHRLY